MVHNQKGFSLPEMLISVAISAIIMGAAFGSYSVIQNNFDWQNDMKSIGQSARAITMIINKDVRMAGFKDSDGSNIADAVTIRDCPGGVGCTGNLDEITVIYDESSTVRRRVTYYATPFPIGSTDGRHRLMRRLETCDPGTCNAFTEVYDEPVADYIEDLQFTGSRGNCQSGVTTQGCGTTKQMIPDWIGAVSCSGDATLMIDGSTDTFYSCPDNSWTSFTAFFPNPFRINSIKMSTAAHLDGGVLIDSQHPFVATWPYGTENNVDVELRVLSMAGECAWNEGCGAAARQFEVNGVTFVGENSECLFATSSGTDCYYNGTIQDDFFKYTTSRYDFTIKGRHVCTYTEAGQDCNPGSQPFRERHLDIAEISFFGEEFGGAITPSEVETSILIRSPNEHGNNNRSVGSGITLGNRTADSEFSTWNDRFLRDWFTSSTVIRNLHYQSQN